MQYEPLNAEQYRQAQSNTFEPGRYHGVITAAEYKTSNAGNPMLVVDTEFKVDGRPRKVRDWVMLSGQMAWRLRELAAACGLVDQYEAGRLQEHDLVGSTVEADVSVEEGEGDFPDKNRVSRYHAGAPRAFTPKAQHAPAKPVDRDPDDIPEDDIPF